MKTTVRQRTSSCRRLRTLTSLLIAAVDPDPTKITTSSSVALTHRLMIDRARSLKPVIFTAKALFPEWILA